MFLNHNIEYFEDPLVQFSPKQYGSANEDTEAVCMKLKKDLHTVFNILPKDMQELLIVNHPERLSLRE